MAFVAPSSSALDPLLTAWRSRTAHQLQVKLGKTTQPNLTLLQLEHALSHIERTLTDTTLTQRSPSLSPPSSTSTSSASSSFPSSSSSIRPSAPVPLHAVDLPTLLSLRASTYSFYSDLDFLSDPAQHLTAREVAFAGSFPSPPPSWTLLTAQPRLLIGRLSADSAHPQRMLVVDDTASVPCHVIHADASLLERAVLFSRWSLLLLLTSPRTESDRVVLEVDASQAVPLSFGPSHSEQLSLVVPSSYRPTPLHELSDRRMRKLSASSSSSQRAPNERFSVNSLVIPTVQPAPERPLRSILHLRGYVVAKSPIVQRRDGVFHFIELRAVLDSAHSVFALFHGPSSMCWYHSLHLDAEYLLVNARVKALALSGGRVKFVVVASTVSAQAAASKGQPNAVVYSARSSQLPGCTVERSVRVETHVKREAGDPLSSMPSSAAGAVGASCHGPRPRRAWSYVGVVTRQVAVCVYELDHGRMGVEPRSSTSAFSSDPLSARFRPSLRLYLTRHDCAALHDGAGIRPGCTVRLHHVHALYHSGRFVGFGCCARSHVSVLAFSPLSVLCRPLRRHGEQALLWSAFQRLNLPDTALFVDTMETLLRKWGRAVKQDLLDNPRDGRHGVLRRLLADRLRWDYTDDIYDQLLDHDERCAIASAPPASDVDASSPQQRSYPCFPSLSVLWQLLSVSRAFERLRRRIRQDSHSTAAWHCERVSSSALCSPGVVFTGFLNASLSTYAGKAYSIPRPLVIDDDEDEAMPVVTSLFTGLQLSDSSSATSFAIDCLLIGDCDEEQLGGLYQLTAFDLVLECVPPAPALGSAVDPPELSTAASCAHVVAYLLVERAALIPLIPRAPPAAASNSSLPALSETELTLYIAHRFTRVVPAALSGKQPPTITSSVTHSQASSLPLGLRAWQEEKAADDAAHVQSRPAAARCTQTIDCNLHGLLVTAETRSPERVAVALTGELLSIGPLVHSGQIVHLSSCQRVRRMGSADAEEKQFESTSSCSLSLDASPAASEWTRVMRAHIPSSRSVSELLVCDVAVFGDGRVDPTQWSFVGVLVDKQFRCDPLAQPRQVDGVRRSHSASTPTASGPSSSLALPGRLYLKLRDSSLVHTIDVYVPLSQRVYPAGLVPGATVRIAGAVRKLGPTWKLFMECSQLSEITVLSAPAVDSLRSPCALPTVTLSSFPLIPLTVDQRQHRLRCRVVLVKKLRLSLMCLFCGRLVRSDRTQAAAGRWLPGDGRCGLTGCRRVELRLNAQLQLDDGTANAQALVDGPLVWDAARPR